MEAREVVAQAVKVRREQLGWTQGDLAEAVTEHGMQVDRSGIVRLERGERGVRVEDLLALAAALGATPAELLAPIHGRSLTVGDKQLSAAQVLTWCQGDPEAWRRRRTSLEGLREQAVQDGLVRDLVDQVAMIAEAIAQRERAGVIFAAGRMHNTLGAVTEWTFTEDEHRELARRWDLIGQED